MQLRLDHKICVVTGAAGILCSALVRALAQAGARCVLIGRTQSKLDELAAELAAAGLGEHLAIAADVLDRGQLETARARVHAAWGPVDILINGAGGNSPKGTTPAEECLNDTPDEKGFLGLQLEGFNDVFALNFTGTLLPCQVFGLDLMQQKGSVLNVSSMSALRPLTKVAAYSAAKAAVDSFTKWLSVHLAKRGVRVNAIAPGFFVTEQNRFLLYEQDGKTLTARGGKILRATPMGRFGAAEELAAATVWLCSAQASFVTGIVLPIDGGFSAYAGV